MLYYDGVDSLGRPVVVVNADAVAAKVGSCSSRRLCVETQLDGESCPVCLYSSVFVSGSAAGGGNTCYIVCRHSKPHVYDVVMLCPPAVCSKVSRNGPTLRSFAQSHCSSSSLMRLSFRVVSKA